jgi:biotin carboxylase
VKAIVFIGTHKSGSSRDAIKAAKKLGYYTVVITDLNKQINQRFDYEEVDCMLYCKLDISKMVKKIKELQSKSYEICAIVSFIDPHCETASILAEKLGLNHFTTNAITTMQDKFKSRIALKDTNYIPKFITINSKDSISKNQINDLLPAILKYPQSQGSKDVYLIKNFSDYLEYSKKLMDTYDDATIIVEEFLDGPQYIVETLVINNIVHIVAIVEQEIVYTNGHFIITGYNLLINPTDAFYNKLYDAVDDIINCHGLKNGPSHLEMRYVKDNWKLIEINPRISGAGMNTFLETGLGISLVEETLKLALNEEVNIKPKFKINTFAQYIIVNESGILERVNGRNRAQNCKGVKYVFIKPKKGSILTPPISMGNRYAFVIATGEDEFEARENAKYAASKIEFQLSKIENDL